MQGEARESASHLPGQRGVASSEACAPKFKILTSLEFSRDGSPTGANPAVTYITSINTVEDQNNNVTQGFFVYY